MGARVSPFFIARLGDSTAAAKEAAVRSNMRTLQIVVESYATDHAGLYPIAIDDSVRVYFPGGDEHSVAGQASRNPFTKEPEWPLLCSIKDLYRDVAETSVPAGAVEYTPMSDSTGKITSYAIIGGGHDGLALRRRSDPSLTLVYSNNSTGGELK